MITNYDIESEIKYIEVNVDEFFTIKEKLVQAFPGTYGMYLCIHFGQFLNGKIHNEKQKDAYSRIVNFLDNIDNLEFSSELEEYLINSFSEMKEKDMEKMDSNMVETVDNIEEYIENNKDTLEEYIKIRLSDEYKESPAYKMQQLFLDFQQKSGYYDIFIPNFKILSSSYREYIEKLEKANKIFVEKYPQIEGLYK